MGGTKQRALLALLLLNANRVVSTDRLIDQLWGETPPATAATALQGHVSALRKALGADAIGTRRPGYVLHADPAQIDLGRFELLRAAARAALENGDPGAAAERLLEALALWRGEALADIGLEPFAQAEAARLEDARLGALEDRIDADLMLGRDSELVGELERLVAAHPLRERLRAQLMLALYRSGRQAEALDAYQRARQTLVSELGIEPGPALRDLERLILAQDPALQIRRRATTPGRRPTARRFALVGAAVVAAAAAALLLYERIFDSTGPARVPPNSVGVIDPDENAIVAAVRVDRNPGPMTVGAGGLWVLNQGSDTLSRIDPRTRRLVHTEGIGGGPGNLGATRSHVWIAQGCSEGGNPGTLLRIDTELAGTFEVASEVPLETTPERGPVTLPSPGCGLAANATSVWVATNVPAALLRVDIDPDPDLAKIGGVVRLPRAPTAIALGAASVWVADVSENVVRRIDPITGRVVAVIPTGRSPVAIAVGEGATWVANRGDDSVSRVDQRTNVVSKAISVGDDPVAVAVGEGSVWVANSRGGSVSRIDPRTNEVVATVSVGHRPQGVVVADGAVWVTVRP
ncbi:MAG: winged helix-turn-helix domain-containing protein [Actinomycetota bacterium]|nr:winged helix-turn-helix domain-containing protein [Actinomycetota bacterium]